MSELNIYKNQLYVPESDTIWGYIMGDITDQKDLINLINNSQFDIKSWVNEQEYATEDWVEKKNYLTEHQSLADYALKSEIPSLEGYATIKDIPSLDGYATQSWVNEQLGIIENITNEILA